MPLTPRILLGLILLSSVACGGTSEGPTAPGNNTPGSETAGSCPEQAPAPSPLPGVRPEHQQLSYWVERVAEYGEVDQPLMTTTRIRAHNASLLQGEDPIRQPDMSDPARRPLLETQVRDRLAYLLEQFESGHYVDREGARLAGDALTPFRDATLPSGAPVLRVALESIALRCGPRVEPFYTQSRDLAFDRNGCSTIHAQEPVMVLGEMHGMWLAQSKYALGWIPQNAPLSGPVPESHHAAYTVEPSWVLSSAGSLANQQLEAGTHLPRVEDQALVATASTFELVRPPSHATMTARPLTRRAVLQEAFALLDDPYGWGGHEGGRDCSRYLLDIFATFGLHLPRHSARQAMAGTFRVEVGEMSRPDKARLIESAAERGIVLLHFPGHIMLYLGRDREGVPMAIHSFSEYVEPCGADAEAGETLRRVDRITVSDLNLGEGSSRRDFLSRVTHVAVLGEDPGPALRGAAILRQPAPVAVPASCEDNVDASIFRSPARPNPRETMRVIATTTEGHGPVELALFDPDGERVEINTRDLGGPPFATWTAIERPRPGRWTAVLGDGEAIVACEHFTVARGPGVQVPHAPDTPAWVPAWSWERDTENLYSAFVEQLFRQPELDDTTWPNLQTLLTDPDRNLLHDHRLVGEDAELALQPDCADLPYFLRAYFAWKLRLPFAWRQCRRGREGQPPSCAEQAKTNLDPVAATSDLGAFRELIRTVANNVHSSTDRTAPGDEFSDVYPVPLERRALRPGTIYADPFGHVLVVASWIPQGLDDYGVLIAADAQPDGTIGRRRFWRGSFLFTPDTSSAGSGFKAWRPPVYDRREQIITLLDNDALRQSDEHTRWSNEQYAGSQDVFYDSVEALINPRPLDPATVQRTLVDALDESVARRVVSVDNGEQWVRDHGPRMSMPDDAAIFQTNGPWEDFATPSRDMRLLISIDAVVGFPDAIARNPARFGIAPEDVDGAVARAREVLAQELSTRSMSYRRSDGSEQTLTLQQITERAEALEMAYNPNDCIELRWGAGEGTPERSTCRRRAPAEQTGKMRRYRSWFETRQRPPR